jgi:hypothetical protein
MQGFNQLNSERSNKFADCFLCTPISLIGVWHCFSVFYFRDWGEFNFRVYNYFPIFCTPRLVCASHDWCCYFVHPVIGVAVFNDGRFGLCFCRWLSGSDHPDVWYQRFLRRRTIANSHLIVKKRIVIGNKNSSLSYIVLMLGTINFLAWISSEAHLK